MNSPYDPKTIRHHERIGSPVPLAWAAQIIESGSGSVPVWFCDHAHSDPMTARDCARAELARRKGDG